MPSLLRRCFLFVCASLLVPGALAVEPPAEAASSATLATVQTIRLRESATGLRVIILFDRPAPFTVSPEPARQRVQIDLLQTHVDYLPADLTRVADPRLSGIWLLQQQPGLASLELRLPSPAIHIEHFALQAPPALVIDLERTDQPVTTLAPRTREFMPEPWPTATTASAATAPAEIALQKGGSVLPAAWLAPPPPEGAPAGALATATSASLGVARLNAPTTATSEVAEADLHPINRDFDDFPIHALEVEGDEAKAIRQAFLNRQWSSVITQGVDYLKARRLNQDSALVLYMVAEARYRLGAAQPTPPVGEQLNFYQQALQLSEAGELGAFGALRLAELSLAARDAGAALGMARRAVQSPDAPVRRRAQALLARALGATGQLPEAVRVLEAARADAGLSKDEQLQLALLEGALRFEHGDATGAWGAYQRAFALDPGWVSLDPAAGETMARCALATGHADVARQNLEYINRTFAFRDDSQKVALALLYAQALEQLGDLTTAEQTYAVLLDEMGDTPKGREVQKLMLKLHPADLLASGSHYAGLLLRQGKLHEAMAELHRAHQQALRTGLDARTLDPLITRIVPPFMQAALAEDKPFEVVQAWRHYGGSIQSPTLRDGSLWPLAQALARIGLAREAMSLVERLKEVRGADDVPLRRFEARLLLEQNQAPAALALLRGLAGEPAATATEADRADLYRSLAQAQRACGDALGAAQSLQALARTPGLAPDELGSTLAEAGGLFLEQNMPVQAIELGLQGLVLEQELLKRGAPEAWPPQTAQALLLMLARGYEARADHARAALVLRELLARPWPQPATAAEARWRLARAQRLRGEKRAALATLDQMLADAATPEPWRGAARQARGQHQWDATHPNWLLHK